MKRNHILAGALFMVLVCAINSYAITNVGTAGAQFLKIGPGARADSLGGAFSALGDDVTAIYWNPAGLTQLKATSFSATHTNWIADTYFHFVAIGVPIKKVGSIGLSITSLTMGSMEITTLDRPEGTGIDFTAGDAAVSLAYARQLNDKLSFGLNVKYIYQKIHRESARGVALDVGTLYKTGWRSLRIGMCFSNFGPEMSFSGQDLETGNEIAGDEQYAGYNPYPDTSNPERISQLETRSYPLPVNFRLGIAYDFVDGGDHLLTGILDGNHPNDNAERLNIGLEYWYKKVCALRVGYKFRIPEEYTWNDDEVSTLDNEEENITCGLGINLDMKSADLMLDYAFAYFGRLKSAHRITLGVRF